MSFIRRVLFGSFIVNETSCFLGNHCALLYRVSLLVIQHENMGGQKHKYASCGRLHWFISAPLAPDLAPGKLKEW